MLTLYQAEWCPFSSAVREILTELGTRLRGAAGRAVARAAGGLKAVSGSDEIPTLETEDGSSSPALARSTATSASSTPGSTRHSTAGASTTTCRRASRTRSASSSATSTRTKGRVAATPEDAEVVDVPEASQYELRLGDRRIGVAAYHRRADSRRIAFIHTEIDEACEGRGFGARLAAAALADVRAKGLEVIPLCPFMAHYIATHPEEHDLLAPGYRDRVTAA